MFSRRLFAAVAAVFMHWSTQTALASPLAGADIAPAAQPASLPTGASQSTTAPTAVSEPATAPAAASEPTSALTAPSRPAPAGARLFAVPVLEPGKAAWVSVYDAAGRPLAGVSLLINGQPVEADSMGQAAFLTPKESQVTIELRGGDGKPVGRTVYESTTDGWLVAQPQARECLDRIEQTVVSNVAAPAIAYAPAAVEVDEPFVIVGKNLSGQADGDHLVLDGYDAEIFSGSSIGLLAVTPKRMSIGPLREMYVTARGEVSNTVEVDVCRVLLSCDESSPQARLQVLGTNVPALVEIENQAPSSVQLVFGGHKLGQRATLITPGGEANAVELATEPANPRSRLVAETHLIADAPWSPDDRQYFENDNFRQILRELNKAEIVRMKRRLIAVEDRLNKDSDLRNQALAAGSMTSAQLDAMNARLRSLANRQHRTHGMMVARRAVFQALGGTDADYRAALELANGDTAISLEKTLAPLASTALLASIKSDPGRIATADDKELNNLMLQQQKEFEQSMATLTNMWKKMPAKVAHHTRLAPPPEPYLPNLGQLGPLHTVDYKKYLKFAALPPPPVEYRQVQKSSRHSNKKAHSTRKRHHAR